MVSTLLFSCAPPTLPGRFHQNFGIFAEFNDPDRYEHRDGPLYADELAWLYNEIGLASYAEGSTLDALAGWDQGLEINHIIDRTSQPNSYVIQSLCNLGAADIEYGHLRLASRYLREGLSASCRLNDLDHAGRFLGYLALVEHLHGNLVEADALFQRALNEIGNDNVRARSIFLFHRCNLRVTLGRLDEAENDALSSKAMADDAEYPDLVAYARSGLGHVLRRMGKFSEAVLEYESAMKAARKHGIRKLEADILSERSRLALQLGDGELARKRAIEALQIANELVLGLRQTHGLVVLGKATVKVNERELGIAYLRHAKRLADRQQYWLRGSEAEEELHRLGVPSEVLAERFDASTAF
jgi:tetratricopeptide (TPR) repeat protein